MKLSKKINFSINISYLSLFILGLNFILASENAIASSPMAKIQGFLVRAEDTDWDTEKKIVTLTGNVQIVFDSKHLQCHRARIDYKSKTLVAEGLVQIVSEKNTIGGDRVALDYESNSGVIYDGYVISGNVFFNGKILQKNGENEFYIVEADYSGCSNCPPIWSFYGSSMRAELGSYAFIKNAVMRLGPIPILWLPYLIVPLKSDRQTGFLTPSLEQNSLYGKGIEIPFFWAISRSSDALITFKNYEHGGFKSLLHYRYLLSEQSYGELKASYIPDRIFTSPFIPEEEKGRPLPRYFIKYSHYYELPENYSQRAEFNWASDLRYPISFNTETGNYGYPAMENRISLTKNSENYHSFLDISYYINMLQANPFAGSDNAVHRLPEIQFSIAQSRIGDSDFLFSLNANFTQFTRSGKSYDKLTGLIPDDSANANSPQHRRVPGVNIGTPAVTGNCDSIDWSNLKDCRPDDSGSFRPYQDLLRTGQRFILNPSISRPINLGDFYLLPIAGFHESQYQFNRIDLGGISRHYVHTELRAGTYLGAVYGDIISAQGERYKHEIKPEFSYRKIPWIMQSAHPFFGFSDQSDIPYFANDIVSDDNLSDMTGLQFDYNDRIFSRDLLTFSVTNNITKKSWAGDRPQYLQVASVYLAQSYDIFQATRESPNKEPWSPITTRLQLQISPIETTSEIIYYPYQKVSNGSASVRYKVDNGDFYQIKASRFYRITHGQPSVNQETLNSFITTTAGINYHYLSIVGSIEFSGFLDPNQTMKPTTWAYALKIKPPGNCFSIMLANRKVLEGPENARYDFIFYYDGNLADLIDDSALSF